MVPSVVPLLRVLPGKDILTRYRADQGDICWFALLDGNGKAVVPLDEINGLVASLEESNRKSGVRRIGARRRAADRFGHRVAKVDRLVAARVP